VSPLSAIPRPARTVAVGALALALAACSDIHARKTPLRNAAHVRLDRATLDRLSDPTAALPRCADFPDQSRGDPAGAADALEQTTPSCPAGPGLLTPAEQSERAGAGRDPAGALLRYRDAAASAARALAGSTDPDTASRATELHNRAVEQLLRLAQSRAIAAGRPWPDVLAEHGVKVVSPAVHLDPARLADAQPARDYKVRGMQAYYANDGLGVPLVAHRVNDRDHPAVPEDAFFPYNLWAAATAVLHPDGPWTGDGRQRPVTLVLHDPFTERCVSVGGRPVRLASDRTTPLAVQVASKTPGVALAGLLRPGEPRLETGLYMLQPPRRGKIPVVLVHGLLASPVVWAQTVNHLQNDPVLGDRFQFWMFLYPTGDLLPVSADDLRAALRRALATIDPGHTDPDLARTVVVGHSLGGVVSQMLVQDSGTRLWDAVFTIPFAELRGPPDVKDRLARHLLYEPEPYVRRAVFIATPHAGTPFATRLFARLGEARIRRPDELTETIDAVVRANGPDVIRPEARGRLLNGIGQQTPGYPLIQAINRSGVAPGVIYHSIIPQMSLCGVQLPTDGVVPYWSSHIEGAASEKIYPGRHGQASSAEEVTAELKRILHEHLREGGE
jgi:hypothetical protein